MSCFLTEKKNISFPTNIQMHFSWQNFYKLHSSHHVPSLFLSVACKVNYHQKFWFFFSFFLRSNVSSGNTDFSRHIFSQTHTHNGRRKGEGGVSTALRRQTYTQQVGGGNEGREGDGRKSSLLLASPSSSPLLKAHLFWGVDGACCVRKWRERERERGKRERGEGWVIPGSGKASLSERREKKVWWWAREKEEIGVAAVEGGGGGGGGGGGNLAEASLHLPAPEEETGKNGRYSLPSIFFSRKKCSKTSLYLSLNVRYRK